ncbi:AMP-binding protein [Paracraurococcus ruber]|nr:AMP-binding protein [Paracraurococcus ruber]
MTAAGEDTDGGAPLFAPPRMDRRPLPGGGWRLRARDALQPHAPRITDALWHWEAAAPDRPFLRERGPDGGWQGVGFGEAAAQVRALAAALLARGLGPQRPLAILSGNSVRHALLALAAQAVGVPSAAISVPYSLQSADLGKLRQILRRLRPGLVFAEDAVAFARALAVEDARGVEAISAADWDALLAVPVTPDVACAIEALDPDAPAKILFTSGTSGLPKGVVTTQRMMAANQQQILQAWPFLAQAPPELLDWLPWSHVFGGSHNLNLALRFGGTLWIDAGRPMPGAFDATLANLREVAPTIRFDVPRGHALLLPALEADAALAAHLFARLRLVFSAGAALPEALYGRWQALAARHAPRPVPVVSAWGMTETAPAAIVTHRMDAPMGCIGTPLPGVELRLLPVEDRLELRLRGPNVFPFYLDDAAATEAAFDADGFLRTGDAVAWLDPADPDRGLRFDGRLAEDFKLLSGTRIHAQEVRLRALAALGTLARDVVVVGADRDELGLFVFPNEGAGRDAVLAALRAMNAAAGDASSRRVARAMLLAEPPSLDAGEVTDKGSLNPRAILARRAAALERLYNDTNDPEVLTP